MYIYYSRLATSGERDILSIANYMLPPNIEYGKRTVGMVKYGRKIKPVQGGFLVLSPNMQVYQELVNIVKKGDFDEKKGWQKEGQGSTGLFYGSMTVQGALWWTQPAIRVVAFLVSNDTEL